jgi:hypothetical protein
LASLLFIILYSVYTAENASDSADFNYLGI